MSDPFPPHPGQVHGRISTPVSTTAQLAREMYAQPFLKYSIGTRHEQVHVDATLAEDSATVVLSHRLTPRQFSGRSWKSHEDAPDTEIGYNLALGRALEAMGKDLQRQAWRSVHEKESK